MDSMWCVRKEESKVSSNIVACAGGRREGPLREIVKGQEQHGFLYSEFVVGGQHPSGGIEES